MYLRNTVAVCIFLILILFLSPLGRGQGEGDKNSEWYAVVLMGDNKSKLCAKGDIFCSKNNITQCYRIQDIRKNVLILIDVNSKKTIALVPGERVPVEGTDMIFEKTVEANIIKNHGSMPRTKF